MIKIFKKAHDDSIPYSVLGRETNSTDFLSDPELYRDPLPQPYRRIDKLLQEILDDIWHIIEKADTEKRIEAEKYRPDCTGKPNIIEGLPEFNCLSTSTEDYSEFLFIGSHGNLTCVDVDAMCVVDKLDIYDDIFTAQQSVKPPGPGGKPDLNQSQLQSQLNQQTNLNTNIVSINSSLIKSLTYLVVSITDSGFVLMNLFVENKFYPIIFDQLEQDRKFVYKKCEISTNAHYVALYSESKLNSSESQIEIYKCPKDLWNQFAEQVFTANESARRQREEASSNQDAVENSIVESQLQQLAQQAQIPKPILISRIKPPLNLFRLQPANTQDVNHLLKKTEPNTDCIGTGANHCFSKFHLDVKTQMSMKCFNNVELSDDILNNLTDFIEPSTKIKIEFKFLYANRFIGLQAGSDQQIDIPNNLAVCWNNSSYILFYPFNKVNTSSKDLICQFEYCMPFSSQISHIQVSKCRNLVALAFKNNNLIVFDLNAGIDRCCVNLEGIESIKRVSFLPPISYGLIKSPLPNYKITTKLVSLANNGVFHLVDCTYGSINTRPIVLFVPTLASRDDVAIDFRICKSLPNLLVALSETNKTFLMDVQLGQYIIELDNTGFNLSIDLVLASKDALLYLKGQDSSSNKTQLVCHALKLIPKLDDYFNRNIQIYDNYLPNNSFLNERIKNLMKIRIDEQSSRRDRLKKFWVELNTHKNKNVK